MPNIMKRWDTRLPSLFDRLEKEMGNWGSWMDEPFKFGNGGEFVGVPAVDVSESPEAYEVKIDLPGVNPEELSVELREGKLVVSGERKLEEEKKGESFYMMERSYGKFKRVIPFEDHVDPESVEAQYKDGVLNIMIKRSSKESARKIPISAQ